MWIFFLVEVSSWKDIDKQSRPVSVLYKKKYKRNIIFLKNVFQQNPIFPSSTIAWDRSVLGPQHFSLSSSIAGIGKYYLTRLSKESAMDSVCKISAYTFSCIITIRDTSLCKCGRKFTFVRFCILLRTLSFLWHPGSPGTFVLCSRGKFEMYTKDYKSFVRRTSNL